MKYLAMGLAAGLLSLTAATAASASQASTTSGSNFYVNYSITLGDFAVSDLVLFEQGAPNPDPNGYGITWGGCCEFASANSTTVISDPFLKTNPIVSNFILGVTTGLPNDADGQQHLVVFVNDAFAASAQDIAWGTLFLNTDEDTLIRDITTNLDRDAVGDDVFNQAVDDLFNFSDGDAVNGPNGSIGFGSSDTFTAVAFSDGRIIGTGLAFTTPGPDSAIPEPAAWALMMTGFLGAGALLRRRRAHRPLAA